LHVVHSGTHRARYRPLCLGSGLLAPGVGGRGGSAIERRRVAGTRPLSWVAGWVEYAARFVRRSDARIVQHIGRQIEALERGIEPELIAKRIAKLRKDKERAEAELRALHPFNPDFRRHGVPPRGLGAHARPL
jgi:hypothetical protein